MTELINTNQFNLFEREMQAPSGNNAFKLYLIFLISQDTIKLL